MRSKVRHISTILIIFGATFGLLIALMLLAAWSWPGSGADVLDWDPSKRIEARMTSEFEDAEQMLAMHNRRRREQGLEEQSEVEFQQAVAREGREAR